MPKAKPARAQPATKSKSKAKPTPVAKVKAKPKAAGRGAPARAQTKRVPPATGARKGRSAAPPPVSIQLPSVLRAPSSEPPVVRAAPIAPPVPARVVPPPPAKELAVTRAIGRLLVHGEVFGKHRIETQPLPTPLALPSGQLAIGDALGAPVQLERRLPTGRYRLMLSLTGTGAQQRVAALVLYCGRPPVVRWVHAHAAGKRSPRSADEALEITAPSLGLGDAPALTRAKAVPDEARAAFAQALRPTTTAWAAATLPLDATSGLALFGLTTGGKAHTAYWGLDAADQPVCLVTETGIISASDWQARPPRKG